MDPKPCPFCGRTPEPFFDEEAGAEGHPAWFLECHQECHIFVFIGPMPTREDVLRIWNTRAAVPPTEVRAASVHDRYCLDCGGVEPCRCGVE